MTSLNDVTGRVHLENLAQPSDQIGEEGDNSATYQSSLSPSVTLSSFPPFVYKSE